jgi:hypothetical protein
VVGTIIGDGVAQFTSRNTRSRDVPVYDAARASRLCAYAAFVGTPIGHYWFNVLDKVCLQEARSYFSCTADAVNESAVLSCWLNSMLQNQCTVPPHSIIHETLWHASC